MFHEFTGNEQLDLQINRFANTYDDDPTVRQNVDALITHVRSGDMDAWHERWLALAQAREQAGDHAIASRYYGAAAFYLSVDDSRKIQLIEKFRENFYRGWQGAPLQRFEIPYEGATLPAVRIENAAAAGAAPDSDTAVTPVKTLLLFGGFDSYLEELISWSQYLLPSGYAIIMFDGPGQGTALLRGLKLTHAWEKPISRVLDYFGITQAVVMGMSLGGLLVMRAAAFEKRIIGVIAMDAMYAMLDALSMKLPAPAWAVLNSLIKHRRSATIDRLISRKASHDLDLAWKLRQGRELTGSDSPHELAYALERYPFRGLGPLINQDTLLMAGENDQYVPLRRVAQIQCELVNAASVTTRVFTEREHAAQHCQIGNLPLAFGVINEWLQAR